MVSEEAGTVTGGRMLEAGTVWELLELRVEATPDALVLVDDRGGRLTFRELREEALSVAGWLHELGVRPGCTVSWQLPNWLDAMMLVIALSRLDAVQNPIIPIAREREVGYMVKQLRSDFLITPHVWRGFDYAAMGEQIKKSSHEGVRLVAVDRDLPRGSADHLPPARRAEQVPDTRWVIYTSGTTADPKGARHTDASVLMSARCIAERMHTGPDDRGALAFPFAHIGGVQLFFGNLMCGSASILAERFDDHAIDVLSREGVTQAGSNTAFHQAYLKAQAARPDTSLFPRVRSFMGGGATRPHYLYDQLREAFGDVALLSGYGSTETGSLTLADPHDPGWAQAKTEGRPYDVTELRIVKESGTLAGPGEEGEVLARGPQMMLGYVDPALDAAAFDADGFFRTGDIGMLDDDGFLHITGRIKDIIIRKGENVSAREIEELLALHPAVAEVAVVGLPDAERGELVCAAVVGEPGSPAVDVAEARRFLLERGLPLQKVPERVEGVADLPKNMMGKVVKPALRERLLAM
ncbi:AMP-binding protein [Streptomyces sp. NPDC005480]|uniref:class I adenylate-forming enzyme family protein n=1 Tax=Streptomyces sp. NPDC005480 TaxID=3154880 RepID=UPI0033A75D33